MHENVLSSRSFSYIRWLWSVAEDEVFLKAVIQESSFPTYDELKKAYEMRAGFLEHTSPAVPLWIGEFGTCQDLNCGGNSEWFKMFIWFLQENPSLSWSYWPLNGAQSSGAGRTYNTVESYGLLSADYSQIEASKIVDLLRTIEAQPPR